MGSTVIFEVLGWAIIFIEIFGKKGILENFLISVHNTLSVGAKWALADSLRGGAISGASAFLLVTYLFITYENAITNLAANSSFLNFWIARLLYEPDGSANVSIFWFCGLALVISISTLLNLILGIMVKHPSGVLGSVGIILALSSSVTARI